MIRLAFCDDDPAMLRQLGDLLQSYRQQRGCPLEYTAYQSPLELLASVERGVSYHVILLDVLMPGENGMDAARELRARDDNVKLIFLTSSPEYAVQSYTVGAFYYQLKPVRQDDFFHLMDQVLAQCEQQQSKLVIRTKTGIAAVPAHRLEYCEVVNHTLRLHLTDGQMLEKTGNMDDLVRCLPAGAGFLRVHRSYLVNMAYIKNINGKSVTLASGAAVPLPHGKFGEVKEAFLRYAFEKEQLLL